MHACSCAVAVTRTLPPNPSLTHATVDDPCDVPHTRSVYAYFWRLLASTMHRQLYLPRSTCSAYAACSVCNAVLCSHLYKLPCRIQCQKQQCAHMGALPAAIVCKHWAATEQAAADTPCGLGGTHDIALPATYTHPLTAGTFGLLACATKHDGEPSSSIAVRAPAATNPTLCCNLQSSTCNCVNHPNIPCLSLSLRTTARC